MKTDAFHIEARDVPGAFAYYVQSELSRMNLYVYSCRRGQGLVCYGRDPGAYRTELFRNAFVLLRVELVQNVPAAEKSVPQNTYRLMFPVLVAWSSVRGDQRCVYQYHAVCGILPAPT